MAFRLGVGVALCLVCCPIALVAEIRVPEEYIHVQDAIDAAAPGDVIRIARDGFRSRDYSSLVDPQQNEVRSMGGLVIRNKDITLVAERVNTSLHSGEAFVAQSADRQVYRTYDPRFSSLYIENSRVRFEWLDIARETQRVNPATNATHPLPVSITDSDVSFLYCDIDVAVQSRRSRLVFRNCEFHTDVQATRDDGSEYDSDLYAIRIEDTDREHVTLRDCAVNGGFFTHQIGYRSIRVERCEHLAIDLLNTQVNAGRREYTGQAVVAEGEPGAHAMEVIDSRVLLVLINGLLAGAQGHPSTGAYIDSQGWTQDRIPRSGSGLYAENSRVSVIRGELRGMHGHESVYVDHTLSDGQAIRYFQYPADGGEGIWLVDSHAFLEGSYLVGGRGGTGTTPQGHFWKGFDVPGARLDGDSTLIRESSAEHWALYE